MQTWNASSNEPMLRINRALGFAPVQRFQSLVPAVRLTRYPDAAHEGELGVAGLRGWPAGDGTPPTRRT